MHKVLYHSLRVQIFKVGFCPVSSMSIISFRIEMKRTVEIKGEEKRGIVYFDRTVRCQFSCYQLMYQSMIDMMMSWLFKYEMFNSDSHSASMIIMTMIRLLTMFAAFMLLINGEKQVVSGCLFKYPSNLYHLFSKFNSLTDFLRSHQRQGIDRDSPIIRTNTDVNVNHKSRLEEITDFFLSVAAVVVAVTGLLGLLCPCYCITRCVRNGGHMKVSYWL